MKEPTIDEYKTLWMNAAADRDKAVKRFEVLRKAVQEAAVDNAAIPGGVEIERVPGMLAKHFSNLAEVMRTSRAVEISWTKCDKCGMDWPHPSVMSYLTCERCVRDERYKANARVNELELELKNVCLALCEKALPLGPGCSCHHAPCVHDVNKLNGRIEEVEKALLTACEVIEHEVYLWRTSGINRTDTQVANELARCASRYRNVLSESTNPAFRPAFSQDLFIAKHTKCDLWIVERAGSACRWSDRQEAIDKMAHPMAYWDAELGADNREFICFQKVEHDVR